MKLIIAIVAVFCVNFSHADVQQSLGVDSNVDYASLEKLGPWDDRNYQLTESDLSVLPADDQFVAAVPVFFKVQARKENPNMGKYYPRVLYQAFLINYGGLLKDGVWYKQGLGKSYHPDETYGKSSSNEAITAINDNEVVMDLGGAEMTIEMKPSNNMLGVAGVNGSNGQAMYYTSNGGVSWTKSQDNPGASCCDPTVDWSLDSSRVYQADLANCSASGCDIRASYSDDDGHTWQAMHSIDSGGNSDKEFIHVDRSATSAFKDNVYITYHTGNVMQFARSVDKGVSWSTPMAFNSEPQGIGSDISTDSMGNIYYIYPSLSPSTGVRLLKSNDGGVSFSTGIKIAALNGNFDMAIPAMETRRAFIYTSVDVDKTSGTIYAAWTDETDDSAGNSSGDTNTTHAWIQVAKSTNQGASWSLCPHPHDDSDTLLGGSTVAVDGSPVDRFHPWLKVDDNGVVHIGYYDTRNSQNRSGVDFFYTNSVDACNTWLPEVRASTVTSDNITNDFEWGDYNGLSVVLDKLAMGFTDNRPTQGVAALVVTGISPNPSTFSLSSAQSDISVCANDMAVPSDVSVEVFQGYNNPVTLSASTVPAVLNNVNFDTNPISPTPGASNFSFDVVSGQATGNYTLTVQGVGDEEAMPVLNQITRTLDYTLHYSAGVTTSTALLTPANNATQVSTSSASFTWNSDANAASYRLQISDSMNFNTLLVDEVLTETTFNVTDLPASTQLYWKISTQSACNTADVDSNIFSFVTAAEFCFTTPTAIPDNSMAGIDVTLPVSAAGNIDSLLVSVKAQHTWVGDLILTLTHGTKSVVLMDRPGVPNSGSGCFNDDIDVVFDDNSNMAVENECSFSVPAIGGVLQPQQALSVFNGTDLSGDWIFNVSDNVVNDTGTLTEFCVNANLIIFKDGFEY